MVNLFFILINQKIVDSLVKLFNFLSEEKPNIKLFIQNDFLYELNLKIRKVLKGYFCTCLNDTLRVENMNK